MYVHIGKDFEVSCHSRIPANVVLLRIMIVIIGVIHFLPFLHRFPTPSKSSLAYNFSVCVYSLIYFYSLSHNC